MILISKSIKKLLYFYIIKEVLYFYTIKTKLCIKIFFLTLITLKPFDNFYISIPVV